MRVFGAGGISSEAGRVFTKCTTSGNLCGGSPGNFSSAREVRTPHPAGGTLREKKVVRAIGEALDYVRSLKIPGHREKCAWKFRGAGGRIRGGPHTGLSHNFFDSQSGATRTSFLLSILSSPPPASRVNRQNASVSRQWHPQETYSRHAIANISVLSSRSYSKTSRVPNRPFEAARLSVPSPATET